MSGFSKQKFFCNIRTQYMQHHLSSAVDSVSELARTMSSVNAVSSSPVASAKVMHHSASLHVCDFMHDTHFPTTFIQHWLSLSQTDFHSCRTALIPFTCPWSFGLGWSLGKVIHWAFPHVSSSLGAGTGLLWGMTVLRSFLCLPSRFTFILLTLSAFSEKPSCAEDWSNVETATQFRWVYLNTLIMFLTCMISWGRFHHGSEPFPR